MPCSFTSEWNNKNSTTKVEVVNIADHIIFDNSISTYNNCKDNLFLLRPNSEVPLGNS